MNMITLVISLIIIPIAIVYFFRATQNSRREQKLKCTKIRSDALQYTKTTRSYLLNEIQKLKEQKNSGNNFKIEDQINSLEQELNFVLKLSEDIKKISIEKPADEDTEFYLEELKLLALNCMDASKSRKFDVK